MKKYAKWAVGAFIIFYILSAPAKAADSLNGALSGLASAGNSLSIFVGGVGE